MQSATPGAGGPDMNPGPGRRRRLDPGGLRRLLGSVSENSPVFRSGASGSAGLRPLRPRPGPRRALSPSTLAGAAGAPPDLQQIVGQADQLPLGGDLLQAS